MWVGVQDDVDWNEGRMQSSVKQYLKLIKRSADELDSITILSQLPTDPKVIREVETYSVHVRRPATTDPSTPSTPPRLNFTVLKSELRRRDDQHSTPSSLQGEYRAGGRAHSPSRVAPPVRRHH